MFEFECLIASLQYHLSMSTAQAVLSCLENVIIHLKDELFLQAFIGRRKVTSLFLNSSNILSGMAKINGRTISFKYFLKTLKC